VPLDNPVAPCNWTRCPRYALLIRSVTLAVSFACDASTLWLLELTYACELNINMQRLHAFNCIMEQCSLFLPLQRGAGPMALMLWLDWVT
jgi:hypothetical protein